MPWFSNNSELFPDQAVQAANEAVAAMRAAIDHPQPELTVTTPDRSVDRFDLGTIFPIETVDTETFAAMFDHGDTSGVTTFN